MGKRKTITAAAILVSLVLVLAVLAGLGRTTPENPMEEEAGKASRMYLTSSTLALDQSLLANVENANISSGDSKEKSKEEQTKEEQSQQQEQKNQDRQQESDQAQTVDPAIWQANGEGGGNYESLLSLIKKNQAGAQKPQEGQTTGGNGGQSGDSGNQPHPGTGGQGSVLTPEQSQELFYTSIKDGETVTDPDYFFTITLTEKGKALHLVSQVVTLNQKARSFQNGDSVTLKEGANTILVTLRFRDGQGNQVDAPTKAYTVYYVPANHYFLSVTNAKTGEDMPDGFEKTVSDGELLVRVHAQKGSKEIDAHVRLNNHAVSKDSGDGLYHMTLKVGNNQLRVTAGSGVNQQVFNIRLNYQPDNFVLGFESSAITEQIRKERFGGTSTADALGDTEEFAFRISCTNETGKEGIDSILVTTRFGTTEMVHMAGGDGYIHCNLDASKQGTMIDVTFRDQDGTTQYYTWKIRYVRKTTPENRKPVIQVGLASETVQDSPNIVQISAVDYQGNVLYPADMVVTLNGEVVNFSGISGAAYEYTLNLRPGENILQVTATDKQQYSATRECTVTYDGSAKNVSVTLKLSADTLHLGTWIEETVSVPGDTSVAELVEQRLAAYGYVSYHQGDPSGADYYLARIAKSGMLKNWSVTEEQKQWLIEQGFYVSEPASWDTLGEFDFTAGSGWMITLNNYYIGQSMGTRSIRDGDVIWVQFTLAKGSDIGVDPNSDIYG